MMDAKLGTIVVGVVVGSACLLLLLCAFFVGSRIRGPSAAYGALTVASTQQLAYGTACPDRHVTRIETLRENGGRVDWSHALDQIAFDSLQVDGRYDVSIMESDGDLVRCVTCDRGAGLPQKHIGNPAWHPSGEYLIFQAEKASHPGLSASSTPGFGLYSDLWLGRPDGSWFAPLTDLPNTLDSGVLHPHFSPDGGLLAWSQLIEAPDLLTPGKEFGYWELKLADFAVGENGASLSNLRTYAPGGPAFYENHGFSPSGKELVFSSNFARTGSAFLNTDIFTLDLASGSWTQLTHSGYNEHAHFSPDGARIVWMTNTGIRGKGTDYWLMNSDGTDPSRLTYFNSAACPEYLPPTVTAADSSWSPEGDRIAAYIITGLVKQAGRIVMITLDL